MDEAHSRDLGPHLGVTRTPQHGAMARKRKRTTRGRKQDRARVAGGQRHEVRYEAKKTRKSKKAVKRAVKKVGISRKKVERALQG